MQMDVDHVIELQVGRLYSLSQLDNMDNYELLDDPTNTSIGSSLQKRIDEEKQRLRLLCPLDPRNWGEPFVFDYMLGDGGGMGPGQRWTRADVRAGKHLLAYFNNL